MQLQLAFELRSPAGCGAAHRELYPAMLDICGWADQHGFALANFGEHHAADSGYNPLPLVACAAVAGRTRRLRMRPNVLLAPLSGAWTNSQVKPGSAILASSDAATLLTSIEQIRRLSPEELRPSPKSRSAGS